MTTYVEWLQGLTTGSKVKIGDCKNSRCGCETFAIQGTVRVFGNNGVDCWAVGEGCTTRYFEKVSGKEVGSRKNYYKNGYLAQVTELDELNAQIADQERVYGEFKTELRNLVETTLKEVYGVSSGRYDSLYVDHKAIALLDLIGVGFNNRDKFKAEFEKLQALLERRDELKKDA
jgi:hypothetical protein